MDAAGGRLGRADRGRAGGDRGRHWRVLRRRQGDDGDFRTGSLAHDGNARTRRHGGNPDRHRQRAAGRPLDRKSDQERAGRSLSVPVRNARGCAARGARLLRRGGLLPRHRGGFQYRRSVPASGSRPLRPGLRTAQGYAVSRDAGARGARPCGPGSGGVGKLRALSGHSDRSLADGYSGHERRHVSDERARARRGGPAELPLSHSRENEHEAISQALADPRSIPLLPSLWTCRGGSRHPVLGLFQGRGPGSRADRKRARGQGRCLRATGPLPIPQKGLRGIPGAGLRAPDRGALLHGAVLQIPAYFLEPPRRTHACLQAFGWQEPDRGGGESRDPKGSRGDAGARDGRGGPVSEQQLPAFQPTDYKSDLKPVWCAGCGDFGALAALHRAMAKLQLSPWNTVVVSGIGCSSRLPGYVSTYGFNGVHGRALTLATGMKVARPELTVVAVGGDGDGIAIGGNHFLHTARRNLDVAYFLMDNEIYGLTKGQVAPTTPAGEKTKSTYWGNPEPSVDPCELAISFGATWVGRGFSGDPKNLVDLMTRAIEHHGFAFLNILSPCVTWRGDDQFKVLKAKQRALPADHDRRDRAAALRYTREVEVLTTGVLYEVEEPSFIDRVEQIRVHARQAGGISTVAEILEGFAPAF